MVNTVLDLSMGTTLLVSPICRALQKQSQDAPVASPDSVRKARARALRSARPCAAPVIHAISQANAATTTVRTAVARVESISLTPILARTAVSPAKTAEAAAYARYMRSPALLYIMYIL